MVQNQTMNFRYLAAQFFLGGIALAPAFFRLGIDLAPTAFAKADRLSNAFFTTKSSGMGMWLPIFRSIMEDCVLPLHQEDTS